ncbi:HtaA domain-containing protein [Streptomyces sp. NPDC012888]|uniref:HtaA domain-containing protein n=1 Tax=Streptomyces sp. NPDC012888 TaxID=3364855 RepID=UPI00369AED9C
MPVRAVRAYAAAVLLAALLGALLPAAAAVAAARTVQGGRLDWGVKSSFQSYVTGPIGKGEFQLKDGAATVGGGLFRFHSATGSYDPATGAFDAAFTGGVRFLGHRKPDGSHELDLTISRPAVRVSGGKGVLHVDVTGRAKDTGAVTRRSQVPFATLGLGGVNMAGGGSPVVLERVPATLTAQGAEAFAGYYAAGTALDPVSLSADVGDTAAGSAPSATPPGPEPSPAASTPRGSFADAAVDWGVRRTFREYVTGPVGQGKWTLADGALDGGALFRFPRGRGVYDARSGRLDAAFAGTVHFTGAHLDLKLGRVAVRIADGKGVLSADVTSGGRTEPAVALAEFDAPGLRTEGPLAVLGEAPATLTEGGSRAFGSLYRAGTAMDPVSLAVALDSTARLPALPDLGSTAPPSAAAPAPPSAAAPAPAAAERSATPGAAEAPAPDTGLYAALGAALLLLLGAAAYPALRRRRAASTSAASTSAASAATGTPAPHDGAPADGTPPGSAPAGDTPTTEARD